MEFWEFAGQLEHEQLEFKTSATSAIGNTIAAMAMTDGGLILLGISDSRSVLACPLEQTALDTVMRAANLVHVEVQLKEVKVGRVGITAVAVPEVRGRVVTTSDGRLLRRIGSDNQPLLGDALGRFVAERTGR